MANPWVAVGRRGEDPFNMPLDQRRIPQAQLAMMGPANMPAPEPAPFQQPVTQTDLNVASMTPPPEAVDDIARFRSYLDQLDTKGQDALGQQRIGLEQSQRSLDAARGIPVQASLQPLMSLADTWWGGSLARGYQPPESTMDRVKTIETLQAGLQKQRGALSDAQVALLKQRLGGESDLAGMLNNKEMLKLRRQEMGAAAKDRADMKAAQQGFDEATRFEKSDMAKDMKVSVKGRELIRQVKDIVRKYNGIPLAGPGRAEFEAAFTSMQLDQKEQENLGALSGPDMGLIIRSTGDPGMFANAIEKLAQVKGGTAGFLSRLDVADKNVQAKYSRANQLANTRFKSGIAKEMIGDFESQWSTTGGAQAGGFPRTVRNAQGQAATVNSDAELKEANAEGFN